MLGARNLRGPSPSAAAQEWLGAAGLGWETRFWGDCDVTTAERICPGPAIATASRIIAVVSRPGSIF